MMKKPEQKQAKYTIDLAAIEGDGSFQCPKCGSSISPDDESETNYKILDTKVLNDELVDLIVECEKCGSKLVLTGFQQTVDA